MENKCVFCNKNIINAANYIVLHDKCVCNECLYDIQLYSNKNEFSCSVCNTPSEVAEYIVAGPVNLNLCDKCIISLNDVLEGKITNKKISEIMGNNERCSFCNRECVNKLYNAGKVNICDECIKVGVKCLKDIKIKKRKKKFLKNLKIILIIISYIPFSLVISYMLHSLFFSKNYENLIIFAIVPLIIWLILIYCTIKIYKKDMD